MSDVESLINLQCVLGENPLWNVNDQRIYWEDIEGKKVHRLKPDSSDSHECLYDESDIDGGQKVGGFTFQENGDLLLFRERDIALLPFGNGGKPQKLRVVREFGEEGFQRFNDVSADPAGRVLAGSIGNDETSGGLYRVDLDGSVTNLWRGTQISNGMAFTADHKWVFWTDSTKSTIFKLPYDVETGEFGATPYLEDGSANPDVVFYAAPESEGTTDGLTIDKDGHIWTARWEGQAIIHLSPEAEVLGKIDIPAWNVTSLCFGGANLDQFLITTAQINLDEQGAELKQEIDGSLYRATPGTSGAEEFRSKISLG